MASGFDWIGKSLDGETVVLKKFSGAFKTAAYATPEWMKANAEQIRVGIVADVETTGLNKKSDTVIEIGLRQFKFNRATGELLQAVDHYSGLQDPGKPLSDDIKRLTGLSDEVLQGKAIDWTKVNEMIAGANIIVAHNAAFDRPFIERNTQTSAGKPWGCSLKQVDWTAKGYGVHKLEILSIYHGFFADAHRALADADALLNLLSMNDHRTHRPYFNELITNARRPMVRIVAAHASFDSKDHLKERGYSWDTANRCWHKTIFKDYLTDEIAWMETVVYNGNFRGLSEEIALTDNFK